MSMNLPSPAPSKAALYVGWVLSILPCLMLFFSAYMKIKQPPEAVEGFTKLGYDMSLANTLAIIEIACTVIYLIPQTAVLGAILLTGYLGGAVATHFRVSDPVGNILAPAIFGAILWLGLLLREPRLRSLIPLRR